MTDITFTIDDAFYPQIVDAYCDFYDYQNHALLLKSGDMEKREDFVSRMKFEEWKKIVIHFQAKSAVQSIVNGIENVISTQVASINTAGNLSITPTKL